MSYRGRFAPTPSGPLHFGSVIAALGSYLQAKSKQGKWLVRIDDVDIGRSIAGADKIILQQLEQLGLFWDEEVVYQSKRSNHYQAALEKLESINSTFACYCTRKEIANRVYPGTCRKSIKSGRTRYSIRIKTNNSPIEIKDLLQGQYSQQLQSETGDFIIKRADGYFAYHLATVIDDAEQNITEVVRGLDLLDSTLRQVYLQKQLGLPTPRYLHLPVAIDSSGKKISKSDNAQAITAKNNISTLFNALTFLGFSPLKQLMQTDVESILNWGVANWNITQLPREKEITVSDN